jgi:hypothetical protein
MRIKVRRKAKNAAVIRSKPLQQKKQHGEGTIKTPQGTMQNQLLEVWRRQTSSLPTNYHSEICNPSMPEDDRGDLFENEASELGDRFAWAIPDERALRICAACSPIVEIGCGRGYWMGLLRSRGVDVSAFDINVPADNFFDEGTTSKGGPEKLASKKFSSHTLMLCYPDDYEFGPNSMALACLDHFKGNTIIHIGEMLGHSLCRSMENQNAPGERYPWGRTSASSFQLKLHSDFHCVLRVPLPSWSMSVDCLTVWKRTQVLELGGDKYAHIPPEDRIDLVSAAPSMEHLLMQ